VTALLTIILPFFNEQGWIGRTIDSLVAQSDDRFRLLLIDNGSTDGSVAEAAAHIAIMGDRARIISCPTPGKIHALAAGIAQVETPLVATCDADTIYPPDYVKHIITLFGRHDRAAAVMAIDLYAPVDDSRSRRRIAFIMRKGRRFATKCHAGGYAQAFRTAALRAGGGFDTGRWPYVLEDHEIVHRIMLYGRVIYHPDHVCFPSNRRVSRDSVSWSKAERLLYRYLPGKALNWYFYRFLGHRLAARNSMGVALREKDWTSPSA
jgi:glycosyltransferase involved in cell wall biosynthesis